MQYINMAGMFVQLGTQLGILESLSAHQQHCVDFVSFYWFPPVAEWGGGVRLGG